MVANRAAAVAQGAGGQDTVQWLADQLADVRKQLAELRRMSPTSLNVQASGSSNVDMQAYADTVLKWADGSAFVWIRINEKGKRCFQTYPVSYADGPTNHVVATAAWALFNPADDGPDWISSDALTGWGLARPFLPVPLYPNFVPVIPGTASNGAYLGYWNINTSASGLAQGSVLWSGYIPEVSHPKMRLLFEGGTASGTVVPAYTLAVNGTGLDTWNSAGGFGWDTRIVDLTPWKRFSQVPVEISVTWTGAGQIAARVGACFLRGT